MKTQQNDNAVLTILLSSSDTLLLKILYQHGNLQYAFIIRYLGEVGQPLVSYTPDNGLGAKMGLDWSVQYKILHQYTSIVKYDKKMVIGDLANQ